MRKQKYLVSSVKPPFRIRVAARFINSRYRFMRRLAFRIIASYVPQGQPKPIGQRDFWDGVEHYQKNLSGQHLIEVSALISSVMKISGEKTNEPVMTSDKMTYKSLITFANGDKVNITSDRPILGGFKH